MHLVVNTANVHGESVSISNEGAEAVRLGFNPSKAEGVDRLKALAAAFVSECDRLMALKPEAAREFSVAKTNMQTASMWSVLGATKGL